MIMDDGRTPDGGTEDVDAVLLIPAGAQRAEWSYTALLIAEGYRVSVAHDVVAAMEAVVANEAAIVFVPSTTYGRDLIDVRRALHPLETLDVAIVVLGAGWEMRLRESRTDDRPADLTQHPGPPETAADAAVMSRDASLPSPGMTPESDGITSARCVPSTSPELAGAGALQTMATDA